MKRIILLILAFLLIGNICYAEQWIKTDEVENAIHYLNIDSIKKIHYRGHTFYEAEVKIEYIKPNDVTKIINCMWIDIAAKKYRDIRTDTYRADGTVTSIALNPNDKYWAQYPSENWDITINKIIEIGKQQEGGITPSCYKTPLIQGNMLL